MKKRLIGLVLIVCCVLGVWGSQKASAYEGKNVNAEKPFRVEYASTQEREIPYIPFIYDEQYAEFDIFDNWLKDGVQYEAGRIYVTDPETERTYRLNGIADAREEVSFGDSVFFVVGTNEIISVDVNTWESTTVYEGEGAEVFELAISDDLICFVEGEQVCMLNRESGKVRRYGDFKDIRTLFVLTDRRFAWIDEHSAAWEYDTRTGLSRSVNYDLYFSGEPVETIDASNPAPAKSVLQSNVSPGPSLPLPGYGVGGVFNDTVDNSHQCMAFAKFVYYKYANMSGWVHSPWSHVRQNISLSTAAQAKALFWSLPIGSFVQLQKASDPSDTDGHSIIVMSVTDKNVKVYEANYPSGNIIGTRTLSYESFVNQYLKAYNAIAHEWGYEKYDATYHKTVCTLSDYGNACEGHRYERHVAETPGAHATCIYCGYVGNISDGILSDPSVSVKE